MTKSQNYYLMFTLLFPAGKKWLNIYFPKKKRKQLWQYHKTAKGDFILECIDTYRSLEIQSLFLIIKYLIT